MNNPEPHNIPVPRTELGRLIRETFVPALDTTIVHADFSAIELRLIAHLSQKPENNF